MTVNKATEDGMGMSIRPSERVRCGVCSILSRCYVTDSKPVSLCEVVSLNKLYLKHMPLASNFMEYKSCVLHGISRMPILVPTVC
jgi:hypothetical protein